MLPKYETQILNVFWKSCVDDALNALSKMIRKNTTILNYSIKIEQLNNIPKLMNPKESSNVIIYTRVIDHLNGVVIISSPLKYFLRLIDILLNKKIDYYDALNEENTPIVLELGNIINGYFVSSLNNLFDTRFDCNSTELAVNPYRAIEDFGFGNIYMENVYVLDFESDFKVGFENIEGKLFLLTEKNKLDILLEAISKKMKIIK